MNKNKWNDGYKYEHIFDLAIAISTDKEWEELNAEDLLLAVEILLTRLKAQGDEVLEVVRLIETKEYDDD